MKIQGNVIAAEHEFATKSERDLIRLVQTGEKQAYNTLYRQYIGKVYGLCLRLTGDKILAEDAAQEVFIQLWPQIGNYNRGNQFSSWLHAAASNITTSYLRKQRGWLQRIFNLEDSPVMHEEAQVSSAEEGLESYILRLPQRTRIVFVLHAIEGYRLVEVAKMTNMAVGSSEAQFHRAKHLIKGGWNMRKHPFEAALQQQLAEFDKVKQPECDLWPGIELALVSQEAAKQFNTRWPHLTGSKLYAIAASFALLALSSWILLNRPPQVLVGDNLVAALSMQHQQQKMALLVKFQAQAALTQNWQEQLDELNEASVTIKSALNREPNNMALLRMLQTVYQQQIKVIERVHSRKWSQV